MKYKYEVKKYKFEKWVKEHEEALLFAAAAATGAVLGIWAYRMGNPPCPHRFGDDIQDGEYYAKMLQTEYDHLTAMEN